MAYLLNPYYFYKDTTIHFDWDVITSTFKCVAAFYPNDLDAQTFVINTELAIKILSLTTSSSGCERKWSTFEGDWIVEETDVELGASSKDDDLMRELDESGSESDDEEEIDVKFDSDDE
ncbi:unnamed protein product [Brassica oleracea var. botrytis]|uniref:HAT C-terminal dimerisation domain-containing protein n=2 Tax=Brassica TaxID=3705 RepID=A0A8S9G4J4_BRACR|nr:hypothetical protein F2Q68_00031783 [Brassica cretica]CAF2076426.1 unnamed protein product [Brassica napus]CDY50109.1 BnaC01g43570D [Brassica napus]